MLAELRIAATIFVSYFAIMTEVLHILSNKHILGLSDKKMKKCNAQTAACFNLKACGEMTAKGKMI